MELRPCLRSYSGSFLVVFLILVFLSGITSGSKQGASLFVAGFLISAAILSGVYIHSRSHLYRITPDFVESRKGFFSFKSVEVACRDIRIITLRQGVMGRILGFGDVEIGSAADHESKVVLKRIRDPQRIKAILKLYRMNANAGSFGQESRVCDTR